MSEKDSKTIFRMIKDGYTANEIADALILSPSTIIKHVKPYKSYYEALKSNQRHLKLFCMRKAED